MITRIVIDRIDQNDYQTEGFLRVYEGERLVFDCKTLELPWRNNQRRISRIPDGRYQAILHHSPRFGESIWIQGVPNRSEILIHLGNYNRDTLGCILVGSDFADIDGDGQYDVIASRQTMLKLFDTIQQTVTTGSSFDVTIRDRFPAKKLEQKL